MTLTARIPVVYKKREIKNQLIMKNIIYTASLLIILLSVFLMIQYPESGRMNLIAGGLFPIGFIMNILGFRMHTKNSKSHS